MNPQVSANEDLQGALIDASNLLGGQNLNTFNVHVRTGLNYASGDIVGAANPVNQDSIAFAYNETHGSHIEVVSGGQTTAVTYGYEGSDDFNFQRQSMQRANVVDNHGGHMQNLVQGMRDAQN